MKAHFERADGSLHLAVEDRRAARRFLDEAQSQGAFMLELDEAPRPQQIYSLALTSEDGLELSFEVRAVQHFDRGDGGANAVFELLPWPESRRLELKRKLEAGEANGEETEESETRGASPIFRIQRMNLAQKRRLAMKANRTERAILRRDGSPQVLLGLMANPRVETEDILAIVRSPHTPGGLLKRVADDRRWSLNAEIRTAVVRNPQTPPLIAVRLVENLPTSELRTLAKMGSTREVVRKAALRAYLKRQGRS